MSIPWAFSPPGLGKALYSGGWKLDYPLGNVDISSEFQFPLQLVYLSTRKQAGLFGSQWFCPQLESSLLPLDKGTLLWTMPSGGGMALRADERHPGEFHSADKTWRAKVTPAQQVLRDAEGWEYVYAKGKLISVMSPGRRMLEFEWQNIQLMGVQIRDQVSGFRQVILVALYGENKRISSLKLLGQLHRFAYVKDGIENRLSAWEPPIGEPAKFLYQPDCGSLSKVGIGNTEDADHVEQLKTFFMNPNPKAAADDDILAKKQPANYWLVRDAIGSYAYGHKGDNPLKHWDPTSVTLTALSGSVEKSSYAENRGIVSTTSHDTDRQSYYFRAPGQKYDGKLRRIEEGGKLLQEYHYDRKSGVLTEIVDDKGTRTFFEYDPAFHPSKRSAWDPKPIRIRSGTRRKSDIIAEYAYNDEGKVSAAKDAHGNLTRYTYSPQGDIASVMNPAGDVISYTYDGLGRCNSVRSAGHMQSLAYDENGHVKMQTAADGTKTEFLYDANGQVEKVTRNGKTVKEIVKDAFNRVIGEKDALNRLSRIERDARGNLVAQYAPNGSVTRYQYDSLGRRTAQIDGNKNKIDFEYDSANHLIRQTNALGNVQTWSYDSKSGKLTERTNGVQTIHQSDDLNGHLASVDYGGGERLAITSDDQGRQTSVIGPDTRISIRYDAQGRPAATQYIQGEDEQLLSYRYNLRGQRTGLMLSGIVAVNFSGTSESGAAHYQPLQQTEQTYDAAGNLSTILNDGVPVMTYGYDTFGRPNHKTYGTAQNGKPALTADISYDSMGHLASTTFRGGALSAPLILSYEWDVADQLHRRTWNGQTLRYEYDANGQLLKVIDDHDQSVLEAYTYDPAGNMLTKLLHGQLTTMTYNAGNQLATRHDSADTLSYSYDKAGRMLGTNSRSRNSYGWLDKITQSTQPDGSQASYHYWPDGQLAAIKSENSSSASKSTENFLWDGLALIRRNNTLYVIEPHPSGGIPIASHPLGHPEEITYFLNDMLGTTLATVGPAGLHFSALTSFGQPLKASSGAGSLSTGGPSVPGNPVPRTNQLPPSKR